MSDSLEIKEKVVSGLIWIQFARNYEQGIRFFNKYRVKISEHTYVLYS